MGVDHHFGNYWVNRSDVMSNLKCPFCQQELEETMFARGRVFVSCNNPNCIISDWGGCSKQIITELIHTRKALEIIKKEFHKETMPDFAVIRDALKGVGDE